MPRFLYRCRSCGKRHEYGFRPEQEAYDCPECGEHCSMRRDWKGEAVNMKRVPGGGREHRG